jgi:hypothetical protein
LPRCVTPSKMTAEIWGVSLSKASIPDAKTPESFVGERRKGGFVATTFEREGDDVRSVMFL